MDDLDLIQKILNPTSVAVVASSNPIKVRNAILKSLINNPRIKIYPVNPRANEIDGLKIYSSLEHYQIKLIWL